MVKKRAPKGKGYTRVANDIQDTPSSDNINLSRETVRGIIFVNRGGDDRITATGGSDHIIYHGDTESLIRAGNFYCIGGLGDDTIGANPYHPSGFIIGGVAVADGNSGATIYGGAGNDEIGGTAHIGTYLGNGKYGNYIGGGQYSLLPATPIRADYLDGGDGDDTINGCDGYDMIIGGRGADKFALRRSAEHPTIRDFNPTEGDILYFAEATPGPISVGQSDAFTFTDAKFHLNATNGNLWYDLDGPEGFGASEIIATLNGITRLSGDNFTAAI